MTRYLTNEQKIIPRTRSRSDRWPSIGVKLQLLVLTASLQCHRFAIYVRARWYAYRNDLFRQNSPHSLQHISQIGSEFGKQVKMTKTKKNTNIGTSPTYNRLVCFTSKMNASISMHNGTVILMATVASNDEVKKQPLKQKFDKKN